MQKTILLIFALMPMLACKTAKTGGTCKYETAEVNLQFIFAAQDSSTTIAKMTPVHEKDRDIFSKAIVTPDTAYIKIAPKALRQKLSNPDDKNLTGKITILTRGSCYPFGRNIEIQQKQYQINIGK